jgi:hypothetical protein
MVWIYEVYLLCYASNYAVRVGATVWISNVPIMLRYEVTKCISICYASTNAVRVGATV